MNLRGLLRRMRGTRRVTDVVATGAATAGGMPGAPDGPEGRAGPDGPKGPEGRRGPSGTGGQRVLGLQHRVRAPELEARRAALAAAGIRPLPAPYDAVLAICSDNDGSTAEDFRLVRDLLVRTYGLDFGDSARVLLAMADHGRSGGASAAAVVPPELSILGPMGEDVTAAATDDPEGRLGTAAGIAAVLRGDIDHLHGVSNLGPTAVRLRTGPVDGSVAASEGASASGPVHGPVSGPVTGPENGPVTLDPGVVDDLEGRIAIGLAAHAILVDGADGVPAAGWAVETRGGQRIELQTPAKEASGLGAELAGLVLGLPTSADEAWAVGDLARLHPPEGFAVPPGTTVAALTVLGPILAEGVRRLRASGVHFPLFVDCSARCFLSDSAERHRRGQGEDAWNDDRARAVGVGIADDRVFNALADDPRSFCAIAGPMRQALGLQFVNPSGASGEHCDGFSVHELLARSADRSGRPTWVARRMLAWLPAETEARRHDRTVRPTDNGTATFAARLDRVLDLASRAGGAEAAGAAGAANTAEATGARPSAPADASPAIPTGERAFPLYTHLGNVQPKSARTDPYFDAAPLRRLQRAVFGLPGGEGSDASEAARLWCVRASSLYAYARLLGGLPAATTRAGAVIAVSSWTDPVTGSVVPGTAAGLDGASFDVDDAAAARVQLDGVEIPEIARCTANEGDSIRVVGVHHRTVLLGDHPADGIADRMASHAAGDAPSSPQTPAMRRRLELTSGDHVEWAPSAPAAFGAQFIHVLWRRDDPQASLSVRLHIAGDAVVVLTSDGASPPHERRTLATGRLRGAAAGTWAWDLIPFAGLSWGPAAHPGGPLPSHGVERIELDARGPAGTSIHVDRIELIRPGPHPPPTGAVVRVAGDGAAPGSPVTLSFAGENGGGDVAAARGDHHPPTDDRVTHADDAGWWWFEDVPRGAIVTVHGRDPQGRPLTPSTGRWLEAGDHLPDLRLVPVR